MSSQSAAAGFARLLLLLIISSSVCLQHSLVAAAAAAVPRQHLSLQQEQLLRGSPALAAPAPTAEPILQGYSFNSSKDTFQLCHEKSGLEHDIPLEDLLPAFGLPNDLINRKLINLQQLIELLHDVQPDFKVVWKPMLFGEADIGSLLSQGHIPQLVHFTVKNKDELQLHQVVSMASWAYHNPGYSLMLFDDNDVREFMTTYYPELLPTFDGLGSQVERTDMWRYLVLCRLGGVYADSDVVAARPIDTWAQDAGLLVGIENVFTTPEEAKRRDYTRQVQMVQWAIAAHTGHPVVCRMGQYVADHVAQEAAGDFVDPDRDHAILERTGPGIWSSSVHNYIREQGAISIEQLVAGGLVGDVRVLPQPVLGCASATFNPADSLPYVYHMFKGSWRKKQPGKFANFISKLYAALKHHKEQQPDSPAIAAMAAAFAAAEAAAAEAAEYANTVEVPAPPATVRKPTVTPNWQLSSTAAAGKHPRLPILDEQILEHKRWRQLQQQRDGKQQPTAPLAAVAAHAQNQLQQPSPVRLENAAAAKGAAAAGQQPQPQQLGLSQGGAAASGAATAAVATGVSSSDTRKLRSSQLLLVKGVPTAGGGAAVPAAAAAHAAGLGEPELPSRALSSMPVLLSVLVLLVIVCVAVKNQSSAIFSSSKGSLLPLLVTGKSGAVKRLCSGLRASSSSGGLSRPSSRLSLAAAAVGAGGSPTAAGVAAADSAGAPVPLLPQDEVCYVSGKQHGNPHRHKRSWGSSSNFQQL
eukprot:GHRR01001703.1.p1 GENE.GHRR01001703.1~~GHRR01001703.1.p1  ORF type:complete len:752 (+),score=308.39 GHRR01001703.1:312-2567(+)